MRLCDALCHQSFIKLCFHRGMRVFLTLLLCVALPVAAETRIGIGSCFNQARDASIWSSIAEEQLDGFLFLGDNLYASRRFSVNRLKNAYDEIDQLIPFQSLGFIHAVWDDHDYGLNDGGQYFIHKDYSGFLFREFFSNKSDIEFASTRGTYHVTVREISGQQVQFIGLDTRSFRSDLTKTPNRNQKGAERYIPSEDPEQSMLGLDQWAWLEAVLQKPADIRILMSSIQVLAEGHGWERWGNLPLEKQRLKALLESRAGGVLLIVSGDRHVGGVYTATIGSEEVIEVTSSGLNMAWTDTDEYLPNQLGDAIRVDHYAILMLDEDGLASVQWKDKQGNLLSEFALR